MSHAKAFSHLVLFWMLLWVNPDGFPSLSRHRVLIIFSLCYFFYSSVWLYFSVPIFYSKTVWLHLHPVLALSLSIQNLVVGRIFFRNLGMPCSVFLDPVTESFKSPVFDEYLLIWIFKLLCHTYWLFCFSLLTPAYPLVFLLPKPFCMSQQPMKY